MRNFIRDYRFSVGKAGSKGFEIGKPSPEALHISFAIEKADVKSPNSAKFSIWNLNDEQVAILNRKDCTVTLNAGYDGRRPLAFVGDVTKVETAMDVSDRVTNITASDGRIALRDSYITLSYQKLVNSKAVLEDISGQMGVPVLFSERAKFVELPTFSFPGLAKNALDKLCAASGLVWSLQNGILQIRMPNEPISMRAFLLSPDTGLVSVPKQVSVAAKNTGNASANAAENDAQTGWEVEYLLNPAIGVNDYVRLESKHVTGNFRTSQIWLNGDNFEGDWLCRAVLLEAI